jgi:hypothetical protein
MDNSHIIIVILSLILAILSILIVIFKGKSSEYFQELNCDFPGSGKIGPYRCGTNGCNEFSVCKNWCVINCYGTAG